jgi:hypothetical protein
VQLFASRAEAALYAPLRLLVYEDHEQALEENEQMETPLTHTPLLTHKHAIIFGAGGAVGTAVAKEFAAQGATVFLSGRQLAAIEQVAEEIHQDGGIAYAAAVDALDEQAVQAYLDRVAQEAGSIDILLNVMGSQPKDYGNGADTLELPPGAVPVEDCSLTKTLAIDEQPGAKLCRWVCVPTIMLRVA